MHGGIPGLLSMCAFLNSLARKYNQNLAVHVMHSACGCVTLREQSRIKIQHASEMNMQYSWRKMIRRFQQLDSVIVTMCSIHHEWQPCAPSNVRIRHAVSVNART
jgi:hypothetical protein